ncbi:hypothetical protein BDZ91DRAFT_732294 [Kalaharituber pfeilii]|nr:hypothetical protein BDZ91DRAFT_732294 [Kalaharituber pfeilii]
MRKIAGGSLVISWLTVKVWLSHTPVIYRRRCGCSGRCLSSGFSLLLSVLSLAMHCLLHAMN